MINEKKKIEEKYYSILKAIKDPDMEKAIEFFDETFEVTIINESLLMAIIMTEIALKGMDETQDNLTKYGLELDVLETILFDEEDE